MPILKLRSVDLEYSDRGTSPVPLVLLHGFLGGLGEWTRIHDDLARERRVIAYAHRGYGASTHLGTPEAYSFGRLVDDLAELADELGLGAFDLLGHSMGGSVALRYVLAHPDRVRSLVLMSTASRSMSALPPKSITMTARLARRIGMARVFRMLVEPAIAKASSPVRDRLRAERGDAGLEEFRERFSAVDPEAFASLGLELSGQESVRDRLGEITCPTTVIVGQDEMEDLVLGCRELADGIPGAAHVVVPDAEHNPQDENPAACLQALRGHFARLGEPLGAPADRLGAPSGGGALEGRR